MKYLCLAYYNQKKFDALSKPELEGITGQCGPHDEALRHSGHVLASGSLQSADSAIAVRPRNGKVAITDGPFTETKEQVGGFFIIEAQDLNEAIEIASKHPAAHLGEQVGWGIEVRPMDLFEQPETQIRMPAADWAFLQRLSSR